MKVWMVAGDIRGLCKLRMKRYFIQVMTTFVWDMTMSF